MKYVLAGFAAGVIIGLLLLSTGAFGAEFDSPLSPQLDNGNLRVDPTEKTAIAGVLEKC